MGLAHDLEVKLPGTRAAFRAGVLRQSKVEIIARATANLDPDEARAAEALVLDRAGRLTPGGLRAAITRAVLEIAPDKAVKRREEGRRDARVQRWREDSGNAALMGRELPRPRCSPRTSASRGGPKGSRQRAWTATWMSCGLAPIWTCC